jgi:hypothetical protein
MERAATPTGVERLLHPCRGTQIFSAMSGSEFLQFLASFLGR